MERFVDVKLMKVSEVKNTQGELQAVKFTNGSGMTLEFFRPAYKLPNLDCVDLQSLPVKGWIADVTILKPVTIQHQIDLKTIDFDTAFNTARQFLNGFLIGISATVKVMGWKVVN